MKYIILLLTLLALSGCSDDAGAHRCLDAYGFTEVVTTGYVPFSCGEGYQYSTGFEATNPKGVRVKGVVCEGVLTSCTVKF